MTVFYHFLNLKISARFWFWAGITAVLLGLAGFIVYYQSNQLKKVFENTQMEMAAMHTTQNFSLMGDKISAAENEFYRAQRMLIAASLTAILLALALSIAFGFILTKSINEPIRKLVDVSRKISGGDLTKRAEVLSKDEIGILAQSFNAMTDSLLEARRLPENILRSIKDSVFVVNTEGIITEVNQAVPEALGYAKNELVGKSLDFVFKKKVE